MHITTFFASLVSLAAALPSPVATDGQVTHQLQQREIVYNHTFESWPTRQLLQTVSYSYFYITPLNATHTNFRFGNLNGPSSGPPAWDYTVTGEGINIRTGPIYGAGVKSYDVGVTGKPFTVISDFTPQGS